MESESDGEEMLEATYSSMEQPPLIKQLRGILSEYPDNGQIIKEMLQNAEDAEASQVEIIYDERCINQGEDKKKIFRKFFKGPALCVKNNSLFSVEDWRGIKMIASSIKEEDKLKVGRFGLGFKSVFHMTDYPCIMSGDRILMVDPTRPSDQVNAEIKLKHMRKTKGMDVDAFFRAFRDALNIDESIIDQGSYNGTVFWFPLREETSKISSTVYNKEKVTDLFASFEHDSSEILLFLCHLESVSLHIRNENGELTSVASAEISENKTNVRLRREDFVKSIKEISRRSQSHEPVTCTFEMTMSTRSQNKSVNNTSWIIVHYFMGTNCSSKLKQLVNDPDLGFNPLVGVAMPISNIEQPFEGHVFCFMPLPREGSRLTGLPVHVNGFFSLSQNRHHLKWATDDQRIREIKDKDILWNQALIEECVPEAYKMLFEILLRKAKENEIDIQSIGGLCRVVADEKSVMDKWKKIPNQLINYLNQLKFLYSHCQSRFVLIRDALFTTEESRNSDIQCVISQLNVNYVEASMTTISKLKFYNGNKVRELTPSMMADLLRQKVSIFSKLSESQRLSILSYLFSGNNYNSCLAGLPLLPAASDEWLTFGGREGVYICKSSEMTNLFEECKGRLIHRTAEMSDYIWHNLENMAAYRIAQIRKLDVTAFRELLKRSLQVKVGPSNIISNQAQLKWFKRVWEYIAENFSVDQFEEVPLMPELKEGTWNNCKKIQLHPLKGILLKKNNMSDSIARCFHTLGTVVLNDLPSWFPEHFMSTYLCVYKDNDATDICNLLQKLWNQPNSQRQVKINSFNSNTSCNDRDQFLKFMSNQTNLNGGCIHLLRSLRVFKYGDCMSNSTRFTSFNDHQSFVRETEIPFILPTSFILASEDSVQLLQTLGAHEVTLVDQIQLVLKELKKGSKYSKQETKRFMNYLIDNSWLFLKSKAIMDLAQEIPFLKTEHGTSKAKDLFCPEDDLLKDMFCGETDKFPLEYSNFNSQGKTALIQLGLKETSMVSEQDIGDVVSLIQQWCGNSTKYNICLSKSNAVLLLLNKNPFLIQHTYRRSSLHNYLLQQRFVVCSQEKPSHFPASLPQFKEKFCTPREARERSYDNECLVGATMPLVDPIYGNLSSSFGWNYLPPVDKVIEQLILIKIYFKATEKSCSVPLIGKIYKYLTKNIRSVDYSKFQTEGLVWTGDSFEHPKNVIIRVESQGLTDLRPYFFSVPLEFTTYEDLFKTIGCIPEQNVSVLIDALLKIQKTHDIPQSYEVYDKDLKLAVKIVDKLAERRHEIQGLEVILPVQSDSSSQIKFHPASKCTVDKNAARFVHEEGDKTIVFVNQKVSHDSAKALGAKPLNKQVLMGTESMGIEGFGQTEKLTDRISKLIIESYVDGLSVPKELIQNADDAGASVVKFLFDEREHCDARNLLLSREMAECQGPALVVFNNASFSDADFENIKKLNGATKEMDKSKVGRFGLGFCAVYNLTDVPSFISRSTVVIFDPQKSYLKDALEDNSPGIKIDFKKTENRKLLRLHEDQFKPYKGLFECDIDNLPRKEFNGTIFRLPLRTSSQADLSEISKLSYNRDEVCELLTMLTKNIGNMLLFTQNVQKIELYHLPKQAKSFENKVLLFSACTMLINTIPKPLQNTSCTILQRVATALDTGKHFVQTEQLNVRVSLTSDCSRLLKKIADTKCSDQSSWVVVWETGKKESLALSRKVREEKAVPLSAVAVQCDPEFQSPLKQSERSSPFYERGHLFCFLPLPIETSLAFHLNGSFHVTSDRRRLVSLTDDDKTSRNDRWNEYLMSDASVNALFTLLEYFSQRNNGGLYLFHQLWPLHYQQVVSVFHESFFQHIIQDDRPLFWGNGRWARFSDIVIFEASIRNNPEIGDIGFKMLSCIGKTRGKVLVDLPDDFVDCFKKVQNIEKTIIKETEFLDVFLENVSNSFWNAHTKERNAILVYALKSNNTGIKNKIKACMCIPVEPSGILKRPCDLVDSSAKIAAMYRLEEEVFLQRGLQNKAVLEELASLGMVRDRLPDEMLLDRFAMIEKLADTQTSECALNLCQLLMNYLNDPHVMNDLKEKEEVKKSIAQMFIFPVLEKPKKWHFTWKSNNDACLKTFHSSVGSTSKKDGNFTLKLGQPVNLYKQDSYFSGGSVCSFVDEHMIKGEFGLHEDVLKVLQVNKHVPLKLVIKQITVLSQEFHDSKEMNESTVEVFSYILKCLQASMKKVGKTEEVKNEFRKIRDMAFIIVKRSLYTPNQVVFNLVYECPPYYVKVPDLLAEKYKGVFEAMGVRDCLKARDFINTLQDVKLQWEGRKCDNLDLVRNLLLNLAEFDDSDFHDSENDIIAPDSQGFLYPMNALVTYEDEFKTSRKMHVLHDSIPHDKAKRLGAKEKQRKCHDIISIGIPFGQKEKLETRIKNLLQSYPCDSSIMKELLQNADDAKASKIMFIKDYREHSAQKIFADSCNEFQGPSLCVFNDSYFTDKDLQGIHNLGEGSKRQDPTKIGRYGVGFNSVYHLTDTPAFLSKGPEIPDDGFLVIFDPTCRALPGVDESEPGRKYNVKDLQADFPDILSGFNCRKELFDEGKGTLFRLPLRTKTTCLSRELSTVKMDTILDDMKNEMFESLLFVKNVQCIEVANVSTGELEIEYGVRAEMSEEDKLKRSEFFNHIEKVCKEVNCNVNGLISVERKEVCYKMKICDSSGREEIYLIVQKFGFDNPSEIPQNIVEHYCGESFGYLPWGGVAFGTKGNQKQQISKVSSGSKSSYFHEGSEQVNSFRESKAFCFLPIPEKIPLPVHVNGFFRLDDARRGLIKDGLGKEWNECILKYLVVPAYGQCVSLWRDGLTSKIERLNNWKMVDDVSEQYHAIFPFMKNINSPYWEYLIIEFYRFITNSKCNLFPVFKVGKELDEDSKAELSNKQINCMWVPIGLKGDLNGGCFNTIGQHMVFDQRKLESVLKDIGMKVVQTPSVVKETIIDCSLGNKRSLKALESMGSDILTEEVKDAIDKSGHPFCTNPDEVVSFIATSLSDEGPCFIGSPGSHIGDTNLKSAKNLKTLLYFLNKSKEFTKLLPNLLIQLTGTNTLNLFSKERPVYCTEFSWMFPEERMRFIHWDLLNSYPVSTLLKEEYIKNLSVSDFLELISDRYKGRLHNKEISIEWKANCESFPSAQWITWFWKFIHDTSRKGSQDKNVFKETVDSISQWAFLPVMDGQNERLLQVSKTYLVIDIDSFYRDECLQNSLVQLKPFALNTNIFFEVQYDIKRLQKQMHDSSWLPSVVDTEEKIKNRNIASNIIRSLSRLLTNYDEPMRLLENLFLYAKDFEPSAFRRLKADDALHILKYFTNNLRNPQFHDYPGCKEKLSSLPLFVTLNGSCVSLVEGKHPYFVSEGMPFRGLNIFSVNMNTVFLKRFHELNDLYAFLELSSTNISNLYANVILPNIGELPQEFWLDHIVYVRDNILKWNWQTRSKEENKIISYLKGIKFIETDKGFKTCSCFFDPSNEDFKILCNDEELLPMPFRTPEWILFLIELGLHHEITDELLILFATRIENASASSIPIEKMSSTLSKCFTSKLSTWNEETLYKLSRIHFLLPVQLEKKYKCIFPQKDNGSRLICMQGSVESKYKAVCWSTTNVLRLHISKKYINSLGVREKPVFEDVLKHCQNISIEMSKKLDSLERDDIIDLMNEIYTFLLQHVENTQAKAMLQHFPIVHLPTEHKMVTVNDIVLDIFDYELIQAYLYKAPVKYGAYFNLFLALGTSEKVKCYHYLNILHLVKIKVGNNEVTTTELRVIQQAVKLLWISLKDEKKHDFKDLKLYLPNTHKVMFESCDIVMVDNNSTRERMSDVTDINYFIGTQELEIDFDVEEFVTLLPECLRPMLLTNIVREVYDVEGMEKITNSVISETLSYFIQSEQFIRGICRIAKKDKESRIIGKGRFDIEADVKRITELIDNMNIIQVTKLETCIWHKNEMVEGSQKPHNMYWERKPVEGDLFTLHFYFCLYPGQDEGKALLELISRSGGLAAAMIKHIGLSPSMSFDDVLMVAHILQQSDSPDKITSLLDDRKYPDLNVSLDLKRGSAFPQPGSYVEEKFHPFLQQSLDPFDESEYKCVAYEVDEEESEDEMEESDFTPVYKYVHIVEKIAVDLDCPSLLGIKYKIDIGDTEFLEVPGYRLYRFVRPENPTDTLQVHTGAAPQQFLPLDENCKRIRKILQEAWGLPTRDRKQVFKRLLLQWHPDKNRGSEEYATKVFQFIQHCIARLEETGSLSDGDETDGRSPNYSNSSFNQMFNNVNRRAGTYARAYYDNLDEYNRSQNTGIYNHRNTMRSEVRDVGEARRWMKQAKHDFQAAEAFLPQAEDQKVFNWICYMCHQASEKALKAACYSKNANAVSLQDHSLQIPAMNLSPSLTSLAGQMENHLGHHTRMRYPNSVSRPQIPADIFDRDHAEKAIEIAREIIQNSDDLI